jgi:hypothetical protein
MRQKETKRKTTSSVLFFASVAPSAQKLHSVASTARTRVAMTKLGVCECVMPSVLMLKLDGRHWNEYPSDGSSASTGK